ncbi:hypothetical protein [Celeribacter baekdonensis]|uniref:hypothetical protein n=1 Tax=Celeribacter baekdonensis TaxID=875171 RepID=UPI003A90F163
MSVTLARASLIRFRQIVDRTLVRKLKKLAPDFDDELAEREAARQKTERPNARAAAAKQRATAAKTEG